MGRKSSQFPKGNKSSKSKKKDRSEDTIKSQDPNPTPSSARVQPEQMSLTAHSHIQKYLKGNQKDHLEQEDLNAVLRLSQHLRIFGLLSAVGYINQSNDQEGKVRQRTVPVWKSLLEQLIDPNTSFSKKQLMEKVLKMTRENQALYMATWRKSMILANHWNFWARAYCEEEDKNLGQ